MLNEKDWLNKWVVVQQLDYDAEDDVVLCHLDKLFITQAESMAHIIKTANYHWGQDWWGLEFRLWDNLADKQRFMKQNRTFWPFNEESAE